MKRLVGTGISATELACNDQLSSFVQADLNAKPTLPFADASFDVVTCVVSPASHAALRENGDRDRDRGRG